MSSEGGDDQLPSPGKRVHKGEGLWLLSFSDMSLVMLCFFLVMIASMTPNKQKFNNVKEGLNEVERQRNTSLKALNKKLEKVIRTKALDSAAVVAYDAEGLHIEFKDGILFRPGSADTNTGANATINQVLQLIAGIGTDFHVVIEGHTDDTPLLPGGPFLSNWELSSSRGFALMRSFHKLGLHEDRASVVAYAHTRPKVPIEGLQGAALKAARSANRRVVIRIE